MFIRNEQAREEAPIGFFSPLDRITTLMDGGSVPAVKYLGRASSDAAPVTAACRASSGWLQLALGHMFRKGA